MVGIRISGNPRIFSLAFLFLKYLNSFPRLLHFPCVNLLVRGSSWEFLPASLLTLILIYTRFRSPFDFPRKKLQLFLEANSHLSNNLYGQSPNKREFSHSTRLTILPPQGFFPEFLSERQPPLQNNCFSP